MSRSVEVLIKGLNVEKRKSCTSRDLAEASHLINLGGDRLQQRCVPAKSPKIGSIQMQQEATWLPPLCKVWQDLLLRGTSTELV